MGKQLEKVIDEKDLGVTIGSILSFDKHICEKVKRAASIFAVIHRIFNHIDGKTCIPLPKSLVGAQLDYDGYAWSPYRNKHVE